MIFFIALQILPLTTTQKEHPENIVKISETQVILSNIPNAPPILFPFSHVFEMNNDSQREHDDDNDYLFDRFPRLTVSQLLQGKEKIQKISQPQEEQ